MNIKRLIGDKGERKAANTYRLKGYRIIARNFSCRYGEIDIIAQKGNEIVFVEVKTRKNANFAAAREFVDFHKQQRIKNTAEIFIAQHKLTESYIRFDVAEIYTESNTCNIIENAF